MEPTPPAEVEPVDQGAPSRPVHPRDLQIAAEDQAASRYLPTLPEDDVE